MYVRDCPTCQRECVLQLPDPIDTFYHLSKYRNIFAGALMVHTYKISMY